MLAELGPLDKDQKVIGKCFPSACQGLRGWFLVWLLELRTPWMLRVNLAGFVSDVAVGVNKECALTPLLYVYAADLGVAGVHNNCA